MLLTSTRSATHTEQQSQVPNREYHKNDEDYDVDDNGDDNEVNQISYTY